MAGALAALAAVTASYEVWLGVSNPTVVGLSYLLIVLLVAAVSTLRVAVASSVLALLALNYFFMPPVGTFTLEDPQNWVALLVFLAVSVIAGRLALVARSRADEALARRDELARLFDLSRDILLTTDSREAIDELARHMARRFGLDYVGVCLPDTGGWRVHASSDTLTLDPPELDRALASARGALEFDALTRSYGGQRTSTTPERVVVTLVPLRLGMRAVGLLAAAGRIVEPGTLDAIAGLTAIAIERAKMLEERRDAERIRQGAELKTALLASLGHDLKTPLTAIAVAAGNLRAAGASDELRRDQLDVIGLEVTRLNRLFQNIVDMARIETGAIDAEREWVHPADIVDAAVRQVQHALQGHPLELDVDTPRSAQVDPRLTSNALAHLLENAGQYAPAGTPITVTAGIDEAGLTLSVRDRGPGVAPQDVEHLFEQFYRGAGARHRSFGTGMGLAITRGLLAAEGGRVWAENHRDGGACFTLNIPATARQGSPLGEEPS
ncbi:MAG TPA: ATP-binding protein [Vicinamibacterales bacterium]|nr:ATP-binding protein [Vicinamibacterales bacterium]